MDDWQSTFLGLKQLPRELTAFEIEAFFTFTLAERQIIEDRRRPTLKLGLALQIGFLRMSGRLLDAVPMVAAALWRHLGTQFAIAAPDLASLRALYRRAPTLIAHQQLACEALGFRWLSEPQRRALVRALRQDLTRTRDRQRLLVFARRWLYDHQLIIMHERALRSIIVSATRQYEAALARSIHAEIDSGLLERWRQALVTPREAGLSQQSWLWAAPAKHSPRQIEELPERIDTLYELEVQRHLVDMPDDLLRRYARRLANRPPSAGRLIREPVRTIEVAYFFLRYCLLIGTDRVLLMVRRRVADLWRRATKDANQVLIHWADLYRQLLASIGALASDAAAPDGEIRKRLQSLVAPRPKSGSVSRLKALTDRHLFLPRGYEVPQILKAICEASLDLSEVPVHWDRWAHLIASAYSGHTSAINVLARFGSAARGDPLYEVGVVIGRLLRTAFLADYFVNPVFRRELLRVLNRGEATNALKRLIYTGRVANYHVIVLLHQK